MHMFRNAPHHSHSLCSFYRQVPCLYCIRMMYLYVWYHELWLYGAQQTPKILAKQTLRHHVSLQRYPGSQHPNTRWIVRAEPTTAITPGTPGTGHGRVTHRNNEDTRKKSGAHELAGKLVHRFDAPIKDIFTGYLD